MNKDKRHYRLLVYQGEPEWVDTCKDHPSRFIKLGEPYKCGRGSIHEVSLGVIDPNSLTARFANEQIERDLSEESENE